MAWCREGELNPQGAKHRRILSPLRLPVPPSRLEQASSVSHTPCLRRTVARAGAGERSSAGGPGCALHSFASQP